MTLAMIMSTATAQASETITGHLHVAVDNGNDLKEGRLPLLTRAQVDAYINEAFIYLRRSPKAARIIDEVLKNDDIFLLVNSVEENGTDVFPNSISVSWDPLLAMHTSNGGRQTPALALLHELTHALHYMKNPKEFARNSGTKHPGYTDDEEYRTITMFETPVARELGEDIRFDHKGKDYLVTGPTVR